MRHTRYERLAQVMEWHIVSRACLPPFFVFILYGMHLCWAWLMLHLAGGTDVLNLACYRQQLPVIASVMAGALLLLATGALLHRRHPDAAWFQYVTANYYGLALVWGGYLTGMLNMATGVVLMGAPIVGFLLLSRRATLTALLVAFSAVLSFNIACAWHVIPYAPLLLAPHDRHSALLWTLSQWLLAAPHVATSVTQVGIILSQWQLREARALELSLTDTLTGTHNRRSTLDLLERELARTQRRQLPLSVVLFDLDHFKRINDRFGHPVGDRVLRDSAQAILGIVRPSDTLGRFGGEEFLLVLPETTREQAEKLVERCRQRLVGLAIKGDAGEAVPVRASFGLAWLESGTTATAEQLIRAADAALYQAKAAGRDQLITAPEPCAANTDASGQRTTRHRRHIANAAHWNEWLAGVLEWSPVTKACMVLGIALFMALNYWGWLYYVVSRPDSADLVNPAVATTMLRIAPVVAILAATGLAYGLIRRRHRPDSTTLVRIVLHLFGGILIGYGYTFGMLYLPTGVMLICSPLLGAMLFDRRIVTEVFLTAVVAMTTLAFASALGWIPYAPLLSVHGTAWQETNPFWMISIYFFTTWAMLVVLIMTDRVLGRWREREAEVQALSQTDALTGINNRHRIMEQLERQLARTRRDHTPLAVVLLDLDHFKQINDRWGHPTGDRALQAAAQTLKATLRAGDDIGRYGGEEFMLLLHDSVPGGPTTLVERCRANLEAARVIADNGDEVRLSASFGVACPRTGDAVQAEDLIKAADQALYRAKAGGRNRVEAAPTLIPQFAL